MEEASPGRSMPVFWVRPKASKYREKVDTPSSCPKVIKTGLQEFWKAWARFSDPWPVVLWQLYRWPATTI